jgi:hypothetical protein
VHHETQRAVSCFTDVKELLAAYNNTTATAKSSLINKKINQVNKHCNKNLIEQIN